MKMPKFRIREKLRENKGRVMLIAVIVFIAAALIVLGYFVFWPKDILDFEAENASRVLSVSCGETYCGEDFSAVEAETAAYNAASACIKTI